LFEQMVPLRLTPILTFGMANKRQRSDGDIAELADITSGDTTYAKHIWQSYFDNYHHGI